MAETPPQRRKKHDSSRTKCEAFDQDEWELDSVTTTLITNCGALDLVKLDSATINPRDDSYYSLPLAAIPRERRPTLHRIPQTNPALLKHLGRTSRLILLRRMSCKPVLIHFWVDGEQVAHGDSVDLATVLILSIALRGGQHSQLVGELIGLSPPSTLRMLSRYACPPLMSSAIVISLVHATARNFTQPRVRNYRQCGSLALFTLVPPIVASVLEDLNDDRVGNLQRGIHTLITKWPEGDDTGIKIGLVLAGLDMALRALLERGRKARSQVILVLQVIFGGLSGIPTGGAAFSAALPLVEKLMKKSSEFEELYRQLRKKIWDTVKNIEADMPHSTEAEQEYYKNYRFWIRDVMDYEPQSL